jgi:hypothetical protein
MSPASGKPRFRTWERNFELEHAPLDLKDVIGLWLIFGSLCVVSCGGVLLFGGVWLHVRGKTAWTGLWLVLGGSTAFGLTIWRLQPHKAVKHASHRLRHHARKLRRGRAQPEPAMTDSQFDALEDEVDRLAAEPPVDSALND